MSGWITIPLAEACSQIDYGLTASASDRPLGPKFLRITDIVSGSIDWESVPYTPAPDRIERYLIQSGDIVVARTGASTGATAFIKEPPDAVFASYLVRLKAKADFDPRFLYYQTKTPEYAQHIYTVAFDKGAQPNASAKALTSLHLSFPPLDEQREIAAVLGALDDKIEVNRRTAATLEAMARALYRSWFVDFDPVRARAEGRSPAFMDPATAALFPDRLTDEDIPEGWRIGTLSEVATSPRNGVKPEAICPDTPYIGLEHMPRRCIAIGEWGTAAQVGSQKTAMAVGDFLFGKLRPYFHKVGIAPTDGICSTDIIVVRPRAQPWGGFVLSVISSDEFVDYTNASSSGTRMPRTSWADMGRYEVTLPPAPVVEAYERLHEPMRLKIVQLTHENQTLATLRDTLLPRLMSGDLRVGAAEALVGEVA